MHRLQQHIEQQQVAQVGPAELLTGWDVEEEALSFLESDLCLLEEKMDPAQLSHVSTDPAAVSVDGVPFCGAAITTKRPGMSFIVECDSEDPSSARSTGSAVQLGSLYGQSNHVSGYGAFSNNTGFLPAQPNFSSSSQQFLTPFAAANNSNTDSHFGEYGASTAQLQGTAYMQDPAQAMQLQADPYRPAGYASQQPMGLFVTSSADATAETVLGKYQPPAMAAPWRSSQLFSMVMPAPVQQQAWVPVSSQELQHSVRTDSKKRSLRVAPSDDLDEDGDWNPYADSQPKAQSKRKKVCVTPTKQPKAKPKTVRFAALPAVKPAAKPTAKPAAKALTSPRRHGSATSSYRGVGKHKYSGKWEAHLWDSNADREPTEKCKRTKGKQFFLGSYHSEAEAARAYDRASLTFFGLQGYTNFPASEYAQELPQLLAATRDVIVKHLRSSWHTYEGYKPKFPGVFPHQALDDLWEARFATSRLTYQYLGSFTSEEAAHQALEAHRELQANLSNLQQ